MVNERTAGWCLVALGLVLLTVSGRLDLLMVVLPLSLIVLGLWVLRCNTRADHKSGGVEQAR